MEIKPTSRVSLSILKTEKSCSYCGASLKVGNKVGVEKDGWYKFYHPECALEYFEERLKENEPACPEVILNDFRKTISYLKEELK